MLEEEGIEVPVMVETGLYGLPPLGQGHAYLLAHSNMIGARRLSDVEDILTTLTCGADASCLGVVGAGQIDPRGDINSTWATDGSLLVGSGGANDIASSAAEVVVLTSFSADRLVASVHHVTSPGRAVSSVVTERGVLVRSSPATERWQLQERVEPAGAAQIASLCPWDWLQITADHAEPLTRGENAMLELADPEGIYHRRSDACRRSESRAKGATSLAG